MKKIVSLLLALTMLFPLCPAVFADAPNTGERAIPIAGEYVYVPDGDGNTCKVWVEGTLYRSPRTRSSDGSLNDGQYQEGDRVDLTVRISNEDISFAGAVGSALSFAMKTQLGTLAASAMSPYVGATIEGGATLVSIIAPLVASYNIRAGVNGFEITATFEWTHFQHQIQGIDLWDWGFVGLDIDTY